MRYTGSKRRLASVIVDTVLKHKGNRPYYIEPFVGGCNSFAPMVQHFEYSLGMDYNSDLIEMWREVMRWWEPDTLFISPLLYEAAKGLPSPSAWRGFVGSGASYSGKWWGGHAHGGYNVGGKPRNHAAESWRAIEKQRDQMLLTYRVEFGTGDYRHMLKLAEPEKCVIYCDPPYRGTGFHSPGPYMTDTFDNDAYEAWCLQMVDKGALLICSEYLMPQGWVPVWKQSQVQSMSLVDARNDAMEALWMHESQIRA